MVLPGCDSVSSLAMISRRTVRAAVIHKNNFLVNRHTPHTIDKIAKRIFFVEHGNHDAQRKVVRNGVESQVLTARSAEHFFTALVPELGERRVCAQILFFVVVHGAGRPQIRSAKTRHRLSAVRNHDSPVIDNRTFPPRAQSHSVGHVPGQSPRDVAIDNNLVQRAPAPDRSRRGLRWLASAAAIIARRCRFGLFLVRFGKITRHQFDHLRVTQDLTQRRTNVIRRQVLNFFLQVRFELQRTIQFQSRNELAQRVRARWPKSFQTSTHSSSSPREAPHPSIPAATNSAPHPASHQWPFERFGEAQIALPRKEPRLSRLLALKDDRVPYDSPP